MSQAGARSERGDEYQLRVALPWIVRLWTDPWVVAVQVESLGMPGDAGVPLVDDIVVELADGSRIYVQAKKNHPKFETWSLRDPLMGSELVKARDQLEREGAGSSSIVRFYSRSPFGALHRLAEGARDYPDHETFSADAPQTLTAELQALAGHWDRSEEVAFALIRRIEFTVTGDYDEMDRDTLAALRMVFARPEDVRDLLEERLRSHQARLRDPVVAFRRADLDGVLAERGHVPSPHRAEAEQLAAFTRSSRIGRSWIRDVAGTRVQRSETRAILDAIESGTRTVLVLGEPGIGKTCVLLDLADALEQDPSKALLFIKGDRFSGAHTMAELVERGLPDDVVGRCARLAVHRPVVVVIDALDVLSLQRAGGTLELFLGLIDRLAAIENVTVVAACRTFDLQFDPLLRGRSWGAHVTVGLLEVERHVTPILGQWGVNPDQLDRGLVELLRVPGRLWLYGQVLKDGPLVQVGSLYELHDRYLEGVEREPGWGAGAVEVLDRVAARMQETRSLEVARAEMPATADVLQGLLSRGVLVVTERGYAFGHQELLDVVAVRSARRRGERLSDFVAARPGLPFLRPTVRVFCHVLRAEQPAQFRREVRAFVADERIAYHLRRLVAETLAETQPDAEDVPLLRWLMTSHGDLFERFLQRAGAEKWLTLVVEELLPSARRAEDAERWTGRLLRHLDGWAAARPEIVLPTWRRALEEGWPGASGLSWVLARALKESLPAAGRERIPWTDAEYLVRHLVQGLSADRDDSYLVGPVVQAWVEAGGADDVVIDFLDLEGTIDRPEGTLGKRVRALRPRGPESALRTEFLAARMAVSDSLIDAVLAYVLREAESEARRFRGILNETSWRARHNRGIMPHDALNDVLKALEDALGERAARDDPWWRLHASSLAAHEDSGMRYLAVQALRRASEANRETISVLLTDPETFEYGELDSEVSELAHDVYPFLSPEAAARHQALVLSLSEPRPTDTEEWMGRVRRRKAYEHLLWVPRPYRVPEVNDFIQRWESEFGPYRAQPRIYMSGGFVAPPVSAAQIQGLSDQGVLRVIGFWGTTVDERDYVELVGGWDQLVGSVRDAAMNVPDRALGWLDALLGTDGPAPYLDACVDGIALHLHVRFGGLKPSGTWDPAEPVPDGQALARTLLGLVERFGEAWITEHTLSEAIQACTHVLDDDDSAARLSVLLTQLGESPNPDGTLGHDPGMEALNSTRGKAAFAAVLLAAGLAEAERDIPEALAALLLQFARDPRPGVRWAVLRGLPPLTHSRPELAWQLLDTATEWAGSEVWEAAETSLYYNYHRHFDRVGPILERIRGSALEAAGSVYGRIGTLSWLSGHLDDESLYGCLADAPASVWSGVAEVLAANVGDSAQSARCEDGLVRLLTSKGAPESVGNQVEAAIGRGKGKGGRVARRVVEALLEGPADREDAVMRVHTILEWAAEEARYDALGILPLLEKVASGLEAGHLRGLHMGKELVLALTAVMREADESDDAALIARVVALQDRLLQLGVDELDRMLDVASRP
ncbi:MAG TPA: ATP-binding protein [Longimicrobium sp.]|nr:ATP-binding protein [Longimicrobium sp.]